MILHNLLKTQLWHLNLQFLPDMILKIKLFQQFSQVLSKKKFIKTSWINKIRIINNHHRLTMKRRKKQKLKTKKTKCKRISKKSKKKRNKMINKNNNKMKKRRKEMKWRNYKRVQQCYQIYRLRQWQIWVLKRIPIQSSY